MKPRVVLFDLDGTLLDSLTDLYDSVNEMLEHFSCRQITIEQARAYVGDGMRKLVERSLPCKLSEEEFSERMAFFVDRYSVNMKKHTKPYTGIITMLEQLKELDVKTAVISNKNANAAKQLCKEHFGELIEFCTGVDGGHPPKPDATMVIETADRFGVTPDECVVVGDGETDVQTAKNSGAMSVAVLWGLRSKTELEAQKPNYFAEKPQEIISIMKKIIDL